MTTYQKALRKFMVGDGLTTPELDMLLEFFDGVEKDLVELTSMDGSYGFALKDVRQKHNLLKTFKMFRKRKSE